MTKDYLYVIGREEGPVKVGIATAPLKRFTTLKTGCPFKIQILHIQPMRDREHARKSERHFHAVYEQYRLAGEWFDISADFAIEGIETGLEMDRYFEDREAAEQRASVLN